MRTTMDLPRGILRSAQRACGARTKRETVIRGLREIVLRDKRTRLLALEGKLVLDIDIAKSRGR